ncbi:MarR family winged helix-turn-helix transcriptional regulator [Kribbella sp. NPDC050470]|uniref:MarR family winged helix-turn-helix transcriptional regulator n=1 Tax=unclassified Kribbella TaxID=2644121 RepID=UPI0037B42144
MARKRAELLAALVQEMPWYISAATRYQIAVADQLGMPVTEVHAVGALLEIGPAGVRRLADLMGMTTGAVTRLVDRVERAGYVRREPDPADRRRVVVQVVPERVADIRPLLRTHRRTLAEPGLHLHRRRARLPPGLPPPRPRLVGLTQAGVRSTAHW